MADKRKFIQCDCYGEGLLITKFDGEEELYFSYWRQGIDPIKLSWWMRLKVCWMALTKGNYYEDQVILNKEKAIELASWILLNVEASSILEHTTQHGGAQTTDRVKNR
jgi:hypothetical protein